VPYELSFTKAVRIQDRDQYINECCVGGDVVRDELLPIVTARLTVWAGHVRSEVVRRGGMTP